MRRALVAAIVLPALLAQAGCVTESRRQVDQMVSPELDADTPEAQRQVHLDLIRKLIAQSQFYAALAHVQAQARESGSSDELRLLEATARRKLGQSAAAQQIYRDLLKTRFAADAYHGLGLTNVSVNLPTAVWQLQQAVQRKPADAEMRNDLGYALILSRRYAEAMPELATAVELEAGRADPRARNNLVLLMMLTGDEAAVQRLARESGIGADTLASLRRQAQGLAGRKAPVAAATSKKS